MLFCFTDSLYIELLLFCGFYFAINLTNFVQRHLKNGKYICKNVLLCYWYPRQFRYNLKKTLIIIWTTKVSFSSCYGDFPYQFSTELIRTSLKVKFIFYIGYQNYSNNIFLKFLNCISSVLNCIHGHILFCLQCSIVVSSFQKQIVDCLYFY